MAAPARCSCWMCRVKQVTSPCCRWGLHRSSGAPRLAPSTDDGGDGEQDRISALPDHLIHLFLARLGCARAAAHTGLVSQRWRHLWASLHELTFHDTPPAQIEAALARITDDPSVTLLEITVPNHHELRPAGIASLLRAAARVAPAELSVMVPVARQFVLHPRRPDDEVELPCFDRTTSISLSAVPVQMMIRLALPPAGNFLKLESLTLFSCDVEISDMLPRCPRLRKLYILRSRLVAVVANSRSLEELEVAIEGVLLQHVHIHAPLLKKLIVLATSGISNDFRLTSFSAPILEELVWSLGHESASVGFGIWFMSCLTFEMPKHLANDDKESTSQQQHCPGVNELCMSIGTRVGFLGDLPRSFNKMMFELHVAKVSILDLGIMALGHAYGEIVLHLLGVCRTVQTLKMKLHGVMGIKECDADCSCAQRYWRNQTVPMTGLKVEIQGFQGEDQEIDLLDVIFRSATMLERVNIEMVDRVSPSDERSMETLVILEAHPSVKSTLSGPWP